MSDPVEVERKIPVILERSARKQQKREAKRARENEERIKLEELSQALKSRAEAMIRAQFKSPDEDRKKPLYEMTKGELLEELRRAKYVHDSVIRMTPDQFRDARVNPYSVRFPASAGGGLAQTTLKSNRYPYEFGPNPDNTEIQVEVEASWPPTVYSFSQYGVAIDGKTDIASKTISRLEELGELFDFIDEGLAAGTMSVVHNRPLYAAREKPASSSTS